MTEIPNRDELCYEEIAGHEKIDLTLDEETHSFPEDQLNVICAVHLGHSEMSNGMRVFSSPPFAFESEYGEGLTPFPYVSDARTCEYLLKRLSDLENVPTFIELDTRFDDEIEENEFRNLGGTSSEVCVSPMLDGWTAGSLRDGSGDQEGQACGLTPTEALCRFVAVLWFIDHELPPEI